MNKIKLHHVSLSVFTLIVSCYSANIMAQCHCSSSSALSGQWQGGWVSQTTGHRGALNATFQRIDANHVQANFRGNFAKVIPFRYRPVLNVVHEQPGLMILQGSQRLPLAGNFQYQATITGNTFEATYQSRRDHGRWFMSR